VISSAPLATPINTNVTFLDFNFVVDASVPDNRTFYVVSDSITPGVVWKASTGIPLTGTYGDERNSKFPDPNPTRVQVDGTPADVLSVALPNCVPSVNCSFVGVSGSLLTIKAIFSECEC
jgi:hypothetical protein